MVAFAFNETVQPPKIHPRLARDRMLELLKLRAPLGARVEKHFGDEVSVHVGYGRSAEASLTINFGRNQRLGAIHFRGNPTGRFGATFEPYITINSPSTNRSVSQTIAFVKVLREMTELAALAECALGSTIGYYIDEKGKELSGEEQVKLGVELEAAP